jgi:Fur family ferric uptake transcriptional regulator
MRARLARDGGPQPVPEPVPEPTPERPAGETPNRIVGEPLGLAAEELFRAYLRDHNLPITAQRLAIARTVLESDGHLSAEDIGRQLDEQGAAAGTATIYRTLELLVRSGLVVERDFGEGFKRFEPARGIPHHEHLLCIVCGRVTEFRDERLERMTTLIAESHGFSRQRHRLVIHGICQDCQRRRV